VGDIIVQGPLREMVPLPLKYNHMLNTAALSPILVRWCVFEDYGIGAILSRSGSSVTLFLFIRFIYRAIIVIVWKK